ncbi:MAG TPA: ABC transporter ATP-binding protein [Oscillospiraceae bacterium]|nr:ABC transporter ATP-binding protein [Oscillospiraceae bacterium]
MTPENLRRRSALSVFASYYKPHFKLFLLDMACALVIALVDLLFPMGTRYALQELLPAGAGDAAAVLRVFFLLMAALFLAQAVRAVMQYIVTFYGHLMGVRIEADIRRDLFSHMQELSFGFYDRNRTGHLMSRVTGDLFEITELAHHGPEDLFISLVTIIGGLGLMFTIQWRLALVISLVFIPGIAITLALRKRMMSSSKAVKERLAGINGELESSISGMRTAKAFSNEDYEIEKFSRSNDRFKTAKSDYYKAMALYHGSQEFFISIINVLVIAFGGALILYGGMDYVDLISFSLYISAFLQPIRRLTMFTEQYVAGMAGFHRFLELMRTEAEITDAPGAAPLTEVRGDVTFEDVSFAYANGESVLSHIDLHIAPGQTLAVVGPSGGGKTTLCQLIPRFYEATGGRVLVDGADVRSVTQKSLHENIGIVQQDVFLFAGTILDNIRYGRADATIEEVVEAARRAEIHEDILAMPDGYDSYVGERGVMLSGGQKQRVSIARIFLKNPPILILDEATSALDSVTEARIQGAFDALSEGRTTIIIAHRLSTVRNADEIVVVENERITERGTHETLLEKGGVYASLWRAQQGVA